MKWPKSIPVGPLTIRVVGAEPERPNNGVIVEGTYDHDSLTVVYDKGDNENPRLQSRIDNVICHEVIHLWEDAVLAHSHEFSETEVQALGNALHQLLIAVLEENGVDPNASLEE